jgi:hypothetical protein
MYSQKRNCSASVPVSTWSCLWEIHIFPGLAHIFFCSRIGRPVIGIYKSLTDTWMWKLGLSSRYSFFGNICFEISIFCLCSALQDPIYVFPEMKLRVALLPITTFVYLRAIYIFPGSVYLFFCSKIGRPRSGKYVEIGTEAAQFLF